MKFLTHQTSNFETQRYIYNNLSGDEPKLVSSPTEAEIDHIRGECLRSTVAEIGQLRGAMACLPYDKETSPNQVQVNIDTDSGAYLAYAFGVIDNMADIEDRPREAQIAIVTLQRYLVEQGEDIGASGADGYMGPQTRAALKSYMDKNNIPYKTKTPEV